MIFAIVASFTRNKEKCSANHKLGTIMVVVTLESLKVLNIVERRKRMIKAYK